jgi:hypothetical protein
LAFFSGDTVEINNIVAVTCSSYFDQANPLISAFADCVSNVNSDVYLAGQYTSGQSANFNGTLLMYEICIQVMIAQQSGRQDDVKTSC